MISTPARRYVAAKVENDGSVSQLGGSFATLDHAQTSARGFAENLPGAQIAVLEMVTIYEAHPVVDVLNLSRRT